MKDSKHISPLGLPFDGGPEAEEQNAVWAAIHECGRDYRCDQSTSPRDAVYEWLEDTPRTLLVAELVDKLHALGYRIVKGNAAVQTGAAATGRESVVRYRFLEEYEEIKDGDEVCIGTWEIVPPSMVGVHWTPHLRRVRRRVPNASLESSPRGGGTPKDKAGSSVEAFARAKWNSQADGYNQWESLGQDEQDELIRRCRAEFQEGRKTE